MEVERNCNIFVNTKKIGYAAWKGALWGIIFLIACGFFLAFCDQWGHFEAAIGVGFPSKPKLTAEYQKIAQQLFPLYLLGYLVRNLISFVVAGAALRAAVELVLQIGKSSK